MGLHVAPKCPRRCARAWWLCSSSRRAGCCCYACPTFHRCSSLTLILLLAAPVLPPDEPKTPYLSPMDTDEEGDLGMQAAAGTYCRPQCRACCAQLPMLPMRARACMGRMRWPHVRAASTDAAAWLSQT